MNCAYLLLKGNLVVYPYILTFRKPSLILMRVGGFYWSLLGNSVGVKVRVFMLHMWGGGMSWWWWWWWVCIGVCDCVHAHSVRIGALYVKMSLQ